MTIPYLMNCSHEDRGWCLECVKELGEKWSIAQDEIDRLRAENAAFKEREAAYLARAMRGPEGVGHSY